MQFRLTPCLVWLLVASASFAQTFYGSIVGSVNDASPAGAVPSGRHTHQSRHGRTPQHAN